MPSTPAMMNAGTVLQGNAPRAHSDGAGFIAGGVLLVSSALIPLSLLWDYSWESTVGIDRIWAAPHVATYLAVSSSAVAALWLIQASTLRGDGVRLWRFRGPVAAWIVLWGAFAYVTAFLFDRWWQSSYGLLAGIWHPPQLLKAVAFFAIVFGAWLMSASRSAPFLSGLVSATGGGVMLALIGTVTLASNFANLQHSASFYRIACGTYPMVLVAVAAGRRHRWGATHCAAVYTLLLAFPVWLLPLIPGSPEAGPVYNPRDHLLPPPFPVLLVFPAVLIDSLFRIGRAPTGRIEAWIRSFELGLAFTLVFVAVQWPFSSFLLSPAADNGFFAGGGRHWPFFLKIDPSAMTGFWRGSSADTMGVQNSAIVVALAAVASRIGFALGDWMRELRR